MTLRVSDRALVRFLQRAGALDVEAVRQALATSLERSRRAADRLGESAMDIHVDGLVYVVRDGVVVTIRHDDAPRALRR